MREALLIIGLIVGIILLIAVGSVLFVVVVVLVSVFGLLQLIIVAPVLIVKEVTRWLRN